MASIRQLEPASDHLFRLLLFESLQLPWLGGYPLRGGHTQL